MVVMRCTSSPGHQALPSHAVGIQRPSIRVSDWNNTCHLGKITLAHPQDHTPEPGHAPKVSGWCNGLVNVEVTWCWTLRIVASASRLFISKMVRSHFLVWPLVHILLDFLCVSWTGCLSIWPCLFCITNDLHNICFHDHNPIPRYLYGQSIYKHSSLKYVYWTFCPVVDWQTFRSCQGWIFGFKALKGGPIEENISREGIPSPNIRFASWNDVWNEASQAANLCYGVMRSLITDWGKLRL